MTDHVMTKIVVTTAENGKLKLIKIENSHFIVVVVVVNNS